MAQAQEFLHHSADLRSEPPRFLGIEPAARRVQAHDRREDTILHPPAAELIVLHALHMSADIVAPHAIADVGRGRREIRLEIKRLPRHDRIARKTDRITVASGSRVP